MNGQKLLRLRLAKYEPHRIPFYLYELATLFHSYWSKGNEDEKFKFIKRQIDKIKTINDATYLNSSTKWHENFNVSLPNKM